jgi:hypothetical protein
MSWHTFAEPRRPSPCGGATAPTVARSVARSVARLTHVIASGQPYPGPRRT